MTAAELRAWAGNKANEMLDRTRLGSAIIRPALHAISMVSLIEGYRKGLEVARHATAANGAASPGEVLDALAAEANKAIAP